MEYCKKVMSLILVNLSVYSMCVSKISNCVQMCVEVNKMCISLFCHNGLEDCSVFKKAEYSNMYSS